MVHGITESDTTEATWQLGRTAARQAPLSMEFSSQEYWSGLPFTPPGDLSHPGFDPCLLLLLLSHFSLLHWQVKSYKEPPGKDNF